MASNLIESEGIYRYDRSKDRYYYTNDKNKVEWFISVTTWLKKVMPPSYGLMQYYKNNSAEDIQQVLDDASEMGTFGHMVYDWLIRGNKWNSSDKKWKRDFIQAHCAVERIDFSEELFERWMSGDYTRSSPVPGIEKSIRSLQQFFIDRNVEPLASELMMAGEVNGFKYAGALDLPCEMDWNGKRVVALVDYKFGSIWDEYAFQLLAYSLLWNVNYPDRKITHIFNFRPKDWNTKPTYELKNWTDYPSIKDEFKYFLELAKTRCNPEPSPEFEFEGDVEIGKEPAGYDLVTATDKILSDEKES